MSVCVCVRVCMRACVCMCVRAGACVRVRARALARVYVYARTCYTTQLSRPYRPAEGTRNSTHISAQEILKRTQNLDQLWINAQRARGCVSARVDGWCLSSSARGRMYAFEA